MRISVLLLFYALMTFKVSAQDANSYQMPPKEMADLLLAKPTPSVEIDSKGKWMLVSDRNSYPSVEQLALPEIRIAGLRINPDNFAPSRQNFINNFSLKDIPSGKTYSVTGLPQPLFAGNILWNEAENKISFTQTNHSSIDLYVIDIITKKAMKINKTSLNIILVSNFNWVDDHTILYTTTVKNSSFAPKKSPIPSGPTIQQNLGKVSPSATFEDLIKSPFDEKLFEFYGTSQLVINKNGVEEKVGNPMIYDVINLSPDKKYLLTKTINKPFSYLVTAGGFPSTESIKDLRGNTIKVLAELPSTESRPSGSDNTQNVPRGFSWRNDMASTIVWCMPLDSGLIKKKMDYHDEVYALSAPFTEKEKPLFKTSMRYQRTDWGNENLALVTEASRAKQSYKVSRFAPSTGILDLLYERNQTDAYNNPGTPVMMKNSFGRQVIYSTDNNSKLLMNNSVGSSPKGDLPFLSRFDIATKQNEIIWRSKEGVYEYVVDVLNPEIPSFITRRETQTNAPNYYLVNLKENEKGKELTSFVNPYQALIGVHKEKVSYKRADGVDLTGDLYLPKGYDKSQGPLPLVIWAYPREFNSAADAAQIRGSKDRFTTVSWASPVFFVTQGYAVLDNAEMPIVAKEGKKPNDNFIEQLEWNAEAAINKLSDMGVADRNRVAVGGHSYGAFMTANLLAHTKLFKAGIARSGAYNRTLTPFGFQNEDRTYWDEPNLYYQMSPFSFANQIKTPLLLIHGEADDNPGTFPINSERLFSAIKGFGGTVRFVYLPYEAHSYRGKENLLHMLWEMNQWLDKYVKNAKY